MTNLARPLRIFLWSYVFLYAVCTSLTVTQVDLWWQLAEGLRFWHTGSLPTQPEVAFGLPASPYFDEYAGYEAAFALLYRFTGFVGLWLVFAAIYLVILFLPGAMTGRKYPSFDLGSTLALLVTILLIHPRLEQRPELVGVLLQVLLMVLLRASSLEKITPHLVLGLPLLFVTWSNVHSTFVFGLFTLGLWIANEAWRLRETLPWVLIIRRAVLLGLLAVTATALTPYGPRRLLFPFLEASDFGSTALSPEMWPVTVNAPLAQYIYYTAMMLLAWGLCTTRGLPLWLIAFALFSAAISYKSFRFADFAGVSLLFIFAARKEQAEDAQRTLPLLLSIPRDTLLVVLCLFFLMMDVFNLLATYQEQRAELRLATHGLRYASDMAAYPVPAEGRRIPVLCGLGAGAYLSFPGHGFYRPIMDSGMSHFSTGTKRYFFFAWLEPAALQTVLESLHVDYVLIDADTVPWILTLERQPDWQFVTCSPNGMLWRRSSSGPRPLSEAERAQISQAALTLARQGKASAAFAYSTLVDPPDKSLAVLAPDNGTEWRDPFFNALVAWTASTPTVNIQSFLDENRPELSPMVHAVLSARIGPQAYDAFLSSRPKPAAAWYWKAIEVEMLEQKGENAQARQIFDSISPVPPSSTAYYRLWNEVHGPDKDGPGLSAYGRWQLWSPQEMGFLATMSAELNNRITDLDRSPNP